MIEDAKNETIKENMEKNPSEKQTPQTKKDVFLLGGADLEMYQIEKRLKRAGKDFINRNLQWGAKIDDYVDIVQKILEEGNIPVAIELEGANKSETIVDIDHHNDNFDRPASIIQVMNRLGKRTNLIDEMIAANDAAYIPGMEEKMEEYRTVLEERYGREKFERLKKKLIELIRQKDRQIQGVTEDMEKEAEEAIANAEHGPNNLLIVRVSGNKPSPITDRLFSTWPEEKQNLIVVCKSSAEEKNVYYFGRGDVCKGVKEKFSGWGGGTGYGQKNKIGFGGATVLDPQTVINFIKEENK